MIEELGQSNLTVRHFLDDLRDIKGYTSILFPITEEELNERNRTFFYDGDLLEYQVGTSRIVKAVVDCNQFAIKKDGVEYTGEKARALFKNDREFKVWKRSCDGEKNAHIKDACARIQVYHINYVYEQKELQMPKEYEFCTLRELMAFVVSRDFEAVCARYMPYKCT
jgi:hypothetical protein